MGQMRWISARAARLGILLLLISSCTQYGPMKNERVYQSFEFGNYGFRKVTDVEITYGSITIPRGSAHRDYGPVHDVLVQEAEVVPVPETAVIRWTSADGQHHEVSAPMRSFIQNAACFYGFRFQFVDDHVEIYMITRLNDCTRFEGKKSTMVFSQ